MRWRESEASEARLGSVGILRYRTSRLRFRSFQYHIESFVHSPVVISVLDFRL